MGSKLEGEKPEVVPGSIFCARCPGAFDPGMASRLWRMKSARRRLFIKKRFLMLRKLSMRRPFRRVEEFVEASIMSSTPAQEKLF
jgi:hypothetical protein